jgi:hypothetical protein
MYVPRSWVKYCLFYVSVTGVIETEDKLTTSVTEISGIASTGAVKNPDMTDLAIHWPLVCAYGLDKVSRAVLDFIV